MTETMIVIGIVAVGYTALKMFQTHLEAIAIKNELVGKTLIDIVPFAIIPVFFNTISKIL